MAKAAPALIFVATLALGGCNRVDDPANIPRLGHWQSTWRLVGFNIDGRSIDREAAPFPMPPDKTEDKGCVEPKLRDQREINAALSGLANSSCSLASFDRDGASITGQGRCTFPSHAGVSVGGTFSIALDEAPEHAGGLQQIEVYAHLPDGQTVQVHGAYKLEWTRLGDCGT
jgi:Protein of unknown function (DUF3617)